MNLSDMTKDERSLLLYLETRAVDHAGLVDHRQMNDEDREIAKKWSEIGFIQYGRVAYYTITKETETDWVKLSDAAFELAHQERKARSERLWEKRSWMSTEEYRNL